MRDPESGVASWRGACWLGSDQENKRGLQQRTGSGPPVTLLFLGRGHGDYCQVLVDPGDFLAFPLFRGGYLDHHQ